MFSHLYYKATLQHSFHKSAWWLDKQTVPLDALQVETHKMQDFVNDCQAGFVCVKDYGTQSKLYGLSWNLLTLFAGVLYEKII